MLVSIFTPTHNLAHLAETAASVFAQTALTNGVRIEWLLGPNNGVLEPEVRRVLHGMGQPDTVKLVFPSIRQDSKSIGLLKRQLCLAANGEILVELDHDDLLSVDCISRLVSVLGRESLGFAYSSAAVFDDETLAPLTFAPDYGCVSSPGYANAPGTKLHGKPILVTQSHPPTARSFCQILYAPDHVRAWTRGAYALVGGHDASMEVCDDHDLVCRTYLEPAVKVVHLRECLYYYRRGSRSTPNTFSGEWNSRIQDLSGQGILKYPDKTPVPDFAQPIRLRDKYLHALVRSEGRRSGGIMLDVGGGIYPAEGWTSVDIQGGQLTRDVRRGLPFADGTVFAIRAFDFLEHLAPQDAAWFIAECCRVLQHGGWLLTHTPSDQGVGAACDLSHLSSWNTRTWAYFWSGKMRQFRGQAFPGLRADFQPVRIFEETHTLGPWPCQWQVPYVVADLVALKNGPKLPGRDFI